MNTKDLELAATRLRKGEILRLHQASGNRIEVLDGSIWITIDGDPRDIVLHAGQGFTLERDPEALVSALTDARLVVLAAIRPHAG